MYYSDQSVLTQCSLNALQMKLAKEAKDASGSGGSSGSGDSTCTSCKSCKENCACCNGNGNGSGNSCFSGKETVTLEDMSTKLISEVVVGDVILAATASGSLVYSPVVYIPHDKNTKRATFVNLIVSSARSIKMTPGHFVWIEKCGVASSNGSLEQARNVKIGACLRTVDGQEAVTAVEFVEGEGVYTLVTMEPFLVINGVVASPWAYISIWEHLFSPIACHAMAHSFHNIHRVMYNLFPTAMSDPWWLFQLQGLLVYVSDVLSVPIGSFVRPLLGKECSPKSFSFRV